MPFPVVPIVEGHGEVQAIGILFRRLIAEFNLGIAVDVARPIRQSRGSLIKEGGIERAIQLAATECGEHGAVFVLIDSEGDCPRTLAPQLLERAEKARPDRRVFLVLAHHEFEAWFLVAASSLRGFGKLSHDIEDHPAPEEVQDCKGLLEQWMPTTSKYSETVDQAAFASAFNLELARRAPSFDKLYREFERICRAAKAMQEQT